MKSGGYNWCDRCRLFALHSALAPAASSGSSLTEQDAWKFCQQDAEIVATMNEAPPEASLRLDLANGCVPCAIGQISNQDGVCTACPSTQVAIGNQCSACPAGSVPNATRDGCTQCPSNSIVSGNFCVACVETAFADQANNRCVTCPVDAVFNAKSACASAVFTIPATGAAGDACADRFVVEVQNLEQAAADPQFISFAAGISQNTWPESTCEAFRAALTSTYLLNGSQSFFRSSSGFGSYGATVSGIGCSFPDSRLSFFSSDFLGSHKYPIRIQAKVSGTLGSAPLQLFTTNNCSRVK